MPGAKAPGSNKQRFRSPEAAARAYAAHQLHHGDGKRVWREQACPKCGQGKGWCLVDPAGRVVICPRKEQGGSKFGNAGHLHILAPEEFEPGADGWNIATDHSTGKGEWKRPKRKKPSKRERERRHAAYSALLGALPDASEHPELREAASAAWGLEALKLLAPKRLPAKNAPEAAQVLGLLQTDLGREAFRGVPGFIVADGGQHSDEDPFLVSFDSFDVRFPGSPALAFPSVGHDGKIEGVRLRRIGDGEGPKYWWLSSDKAGEGIGIKGPSGDPPVSIYQSAKASEAGYLVTEGEKKAAAAAAALGVVSISIPGVTQWRGVLQALRKLDPEGKAPVSVALDMDWRDKPEVERARGELLQALADANRKVSVGEWPTEYKGLDDALAALGPEGLAWEKGPEMAPRWWCGATFDRYLAREDERGGVRLVKEKFSKDGEPQGEELLATCVVRRVALHRPVEARAKVIEVFEVFADGKAKQFEAEAGVCQSPAQWRRLLQANAPGAYIGQGMAAMDALNGVMRTLGLREEFAPREIEVHRPGFDDQLENYRLPGLRIDGDGDIHDDAEAACPKGFGKDGEWSPAQGDAPEKLKVFAKHWGDLFSDPRDATLALGLALFGPVAPTLAGNAESIILGLEGVTGSGKSTTARTLACLWGFHGKRKFPQHSTEKATMALFGRCRDALGVLDDLRQARHIRELVSLFFDGGERLALKRNGEFRESPDLRGACLLTAESFEAAGESTANRIVAIPFSKRLSNAEKRQRKAIAARFNPYAIGNTSCLSVEAVALAMKERATLRQAMSEALALAARSPHATGGRGEDLAAICGVCSHLLGALFVNILGEAPAWLASPVQAIERFLAGHGEHVREHTPAQVGLDAFEAAIASGRVRVLGASWSSPTAARLHESPGEALRFGEAVCWRLSGEHGDCIAVTASEFMRAVGGAGGIDLSDKAVQASLASEGLLLSGEGPAPRVRFKSLDGGSQRVRVWLLRLDEDGGLLRPGWDSGTGASQEGPELSQEQEHSYEKGLEPVLGQWDSGTVAQTQNILPQKADAKLPSKDAGNSIKISLPIRPTSDASKLSHCPKRVEKPSGNKGSSRDSGSFSNCPGTVAELSQTVPPPRPGPEAWEKVRNVGDLERLPEADQDKIAVELVPLMMAANPPVRDFAAASPEMFAEAVRAVASRQGVHHD